MSKPNKARFKLSQVKAQYVEAAGGETVEFETDAGTVLEFQHPVFGDEEWASSIDAQQTPSGKARAILGDEQYEKFTAEGGNPTDILLLFQGVQAEYQDKSRTVRPIRS